MRQRVEEATKKGFTPMSTRRVTALGRVIGVQGGENQMAGQRRIDGNGRGFHVANFTDHHHVGRLAQNGTQRGGKRQADGFTDLHLVDAGQHVFHRVLDRDDFAVGTIDEVEAGIKGRGLAGTGRAGHEQNAVGQTNHALERLLVVREKSQFRQTEPQAFLVENTHDDAFAVVRRQARHAQVNQLGADLALNASVLRNAMLGDGHVRLDFQPGDDGRLQPFRRGLHLVQHAVNAVAQTEPFAQRLQMNVRGAHLEGIHDDLVHQPDERRIRVHRPAIVIQPALRHLDFAFASVPESPCPPAVSVPCRRNICSARPRCPIPTPRADRFPR